MGEGYYKDLREYIEVLENDGKLYRITDPINKDTELMPLVRWQYRGLPEEERRAWLFENVTDAKGRKYGNSRVAVGLLGGTTEIFAKALKCSPDEIWDKYAEGLLKPIEPEICLLY